LNERGKKDNNPHWKGRALKFGEPVSGGSKKRVNRMKERIERNACALSTEEGDNCCGGGKSLRGKLLGGKSLASPRRDAGWKPRDFLSKEKDS